MSASQTVTIPAAANSKNTVRAAPAGPGAEPGPLSTPTLASLLAEPGQRQRLLASYDRALRQHEHAGHVEQAGHATNGPGRPAIIWRITTAGRDWLDDHDNAPALAQRKTEQARRTASERDHALEQARATFNRQTPRISRKRAAHQLRDLGCTLDQIGAIFHVSKETDSPGPPLGPPGTTSRPHTPQDAQTARGHLKRRPPRCRHSPGAAIAAAVTRPEPMIIIRAPGRSARTGHHAAHDRGSRTVRRRSWLV